MNLRALLEHRDLILVTGKGGTGKSTLTAALAELAARVRGGAVAVDLSAHPRLPELVSAEAQVRVVGIDAEEAVGPALGRVVRLPALAQAVLKNGLIRLFIRTSPAIREMIVLDELAHLVERSAGRGMPVIVDLPASGHAVSYLGTPGSVRRMLRVGPLAEVARRVESLILDRSRTELVAVALPEELPVNETIELLRRAEALGVAAGTVFVNQVPEAPVESGDRELLETMAREKEGALGRIATAARIECEMVDEARAQIDRLRAGLSAEIVEVHRRHAPGPRACVEQLVQELSP